MKNNNNNNSRQKDNQIILPSWVLVLLFIAPLLIALVIYINWSNLYFSENTEDNSYISQAQLKSENNNK